MFGRNCESRWSCRHLVTKGRTDAGQRRRHKGLSEDDIKKRAMETFFEVTRDHMDDVNKLRSYLQSIHLSTWCWCMQRVLGIHVWESGV